MTAPITVPLVAGMVPDGSPAPVMVLRSPIKDEPYFGHITERREGERHMAGTPYEGQEADTYRVNGHYNGIVYPSEIALILTDPGGVGACLALRWLAGRLGVPVPVVGCPRWSPLTAGTVYQLGAGRNIALFVFGTIGRLDEVAINGIGVPVLRCPALPNPDSADAPIRALALAVETVGGAS